MYSWDFGFLVCDCFWRMFLDGEVTSRRPVWPSPPAMSSRWDWMLGIIFMVAISVIVIVSTFACIVFCKCKRKLKQAKTVGIAPTEQDEESGEAGARSRDPAGLASSCTNAPNMKSLVASFVREFFHLTQSLSSHKWAWEVANEYTRDNNMATNIPYTLNQPSYQEMTTWLIDSKIV